MADTFTPEQIAQILEEFFKVVGTRQYIGARYVPIFGRKGETSIEWDNTAPYEPLTIVLYQGNSYTSRQFVPVGVEITNQEFWAITGNYNAQVEQYRRETAAAKAAADAAQESADNAQADIDKLLPKADFDAENTVKKYVDDTSSKIQADIDTLLPKADFDAENTVKKYVDDTSSKIVERFDNVTLIFDSVDAMKSHEGFTVGQIVATRGYYDVADGGASVYEIVTNDGTATFRREVINNELAAQNTDPDFFINVNKYGVLGDEQDTAGYWAKLQAIVNELEPNPVRYGYTERAYHKLYFPAGKYHIFGRLHFAGYTEICGESNTGYNINFPKDDTCPTCFICHTEDSGFLFSGFDDNNNIITNVNFSNNSSNPPVPSYYFSKKADASNIRLHDFTIWRDTSGSVIPDLAICLKHCTDSIIERVSVHGFYAGLFVEASWNTYIEQLLCNCQYIGAAFYGSNGGVNICDSYLTVNRQRRINAFNPLGIAVVWGSVYGVDAPSVGLIINQHEIKVNNVIIENAGYSVAVVNVYSQQLVGMHFEVASLSNIYVTRNADDVLAPTTCNVYVTDPSSYNNVTTDPDMCLYELHGNSNMYVRNAVQQRNVKLVKNEGTGKLYYVDSELSYGQESQVDFTNVLFRPVELGNVYSGRITLAQNTTYDIPTALVQNGLYLLSISGQQAQYTYVAIISVQWWAPENSVITPLKANSSYTPSVKVTDNNRLVQFENATLTGNVVVSLQRLV